ncbi:MAG: hypothetical protein AAGL18_09465, partial [Pseudomonadota bacterium]
MKQLQSATPPRTCQRAWTLNTVAVIGMPAALMLIAAPVSAQTTAATDEKVTNAVAPASEVKQAAAATTAPDAPAPQATVTPDTEAEPETEAGKDFSRFANAAEVSVIQPNYDDIIGFMNSHAAIDKSRVKLDYNAMRAGRAAGLARILQRMRDIPVSQLNRDDQLAYWLNLRNL